MVIYSGYMLLAIVINSFLTIKSKISKHKKTLFYGLFMGFLLFLLAALRDKSVGTDSYRYAEVYNLIANYDLFSILKTYGFESGYYLLVKFLTLFSQNYQLSFIAISAIYAYAITRFIIKYSYGYMASFIMLISMKYFAFSMSGLRQTVAIALLLISIDYIISGKPLKFFIFVLIGSFFHNSAIVFLLFYLMKYVKVNKLVITIYFLFIPLVYIFRSSIISFVHIFIYSDYIISESASSGIVTLIVYIFILLVVLFFKDLLIKKNNSLLIFIHMMYFGVVTQIFVPFQANIFRVSMYFNIASIILIPALISLFEKKQTRFLLYVFLIILMGIQYFLFTYNAAGSNPYIFFWEG